MTKFSIYFFTIFLCMTLSDAKKYKIKLISIDRCNDMEGKEDKSEPVIYETSTKKLNRHISVIRTNFTILRKLGPVMINFRIFHLHKSGKDLVFKLEKIDCHNPFSYQLVRVLHVQLDNECMALPGTYITDNINLQDFSWVLTKVMITPGKYNYDLDFYTSHGIAVCNTIACEILEVK